MTAQLTTTTTAWSPAVVSTKPSPPLSRQGLLSTFALLNRHWHNVASDILYSNPKFGNSRLSSRTAFLKFLSIISTSAASYGSLVRTLDLSYVDESIYESIPETWLSIVLKQCPNLSTLNLHSTTFITSEAVRCIQPNTHHALRSLTISSVENLSSSGLRTLLSHFPNLVHLNANSCPTAFNDETFLSLANFCPNLTHLDISGTYLTSKAFSDLPGLPLKSLNLSSILALTDTSVSAICKTYPNLTSLTLANNPHLTTLSLHHIARLPLTNLTLTLPTITPSLHLLTTLLKNLSQKLTSFSLPYPYLNTHRTEKPSLLSLFSLLTNLTHLEFTHITSSTPNNIIYNIITTLASKGALKDVVLRRETYEKDWIVTGMYADVQEGFLVVDEAFVERVRGVVGEGCVIRLVVQE